MEIRRNRIVNKMTLKENIQEDLKSALKEKKELEVATLRMLLAAIQNKETEKRTKFWRQKPEAQSEELEKESHLTETEVLEVIFSEIKKRKEAILEYEKGKREELAKKEKAESEILEKYLPEQLPEEEIKKLATEAIDKVGAKGIKDLGKVMAELMPKVKGRVEGSLVSKIVKELIQQSETIG